MKVYFLIFLSTLALVSCEKKNATGNKYFDMDGLIDNQVNYLIKMKASITKSVAVDSAKDQSTFIPDSLGWTDELSVFRHLELINKPIYAQAYEVLDGIKDDNSNLMVMTLNAKIDVPVKQFKIFYQNDLEKIKRIEAQIVEQSSLYFTVRTFTIELDDHQGVPALSQLNVSGVQKMILRDSVRFSISSTINY
ncbi:MAG TPA: hypothetical protein VIS49_03465 [Cyclobacteriaceae bacterium]